MTGAKEIDTDVRPKYYEVYGEQIANGNKAWLLAFSMAAVALIAVGMALFIRMQPPTVIRIGPNGEATVLGKPIPGSKDASARSGTDAFLNQAFVKRFLSTYLNYAPANVDERWAASLNMMTRNLRGYTVKAMKDGNIRGKIDDDQTQSVFHLHEIDPTPGDPLAFTAYGVKEVHHLKDGTEVTDRLVNEYHVRLVADQRSELNPDGLWIAEYGERSLDGERRDQILAAVDSNSSKD
jgi:hypothetical protein